MKLLQDQIQVLTNVIEKNSDITREYVVASLAPIDNNLFPIFLSTTGSLVKYNKKLRRSQLRICYTILFHVGLPLNELRNLKFKDISDAIQTSQFSLIHYKTNQPHIHLLSYKAVEDLKNSCQLNRIASNIKSDSFRINMISNLLKITSVQNAANIIGHQDIRSTMSYERYALTKAKIQDLLQRIIDS